LRSIIRALLAACVFAGAAAAQTSAGIEQVVVTAASNASTRTIFPDESNLTGTLTIADALSENVPSAILSDTESNPFQPDLFYRGFDASSVLGTAEGLAVYENGDRINEAFGDVVLWDMVPLFAVSRIDVLPGSDPVLGLNALGGAVALAMKTGFDSEAPEQSRIDLSGGSFGRARATAQAFRQWGNQALYIGMSAMHDDGWRRASPSNVIQSYGDFSVQGAKGSAGVSISYATDKLSENAAVPVQDDPRAAFAIPDITKDSVVFLQLRGDTALDSALTARADGFLRSTQITSLNGEPSGFAACVSPAAQLCDNAGDPLATLGGVPVSAGTAGNGTLSVQKTQTIEGGATAQLEWKSTVFGRDDKAILGATFDDAPTDFAFATQLGGLVFEPGDVTTVAPNGIFLGGGEWNTRLHTVNADAGIYVEDTLDITSSLSLTVSGRGNFDRIDLTDRYGTALTGNHMFSAVNPSAKLQWKLPEGTSLYIDVGQSSRTPTASELSCANPAVPCLFPLSFISDPGLRQVIAQTVEAGARGKLTAGDATLGWFADVYDTRNRNDIQFISSGPFVGSGYFANIGDTERRGAEAELNLAWGNFEASANYAFVDATFRSNFFEPSAFNPAANANAEIFVSRGDRLPAIPAHTAKLSLGWRATDNLHLKLEMNAQSAQYLRGDEANLQPQLPGYAVFDAEADYSVSPSLTLTLEAQNIFDTRYATFGLYGDPTGAGTFPQFTNPRFIVPAQPFGLWAGVRAAL
jgi:outer membrane receptor protein involved in Fe transport